MDYVLVMSVNPGFGGQKFIPATLHKMRQLAEIRSQRRLTYRIEVDGGVALDTVGDVVRAGAEILVAGNAVFGSGDPKRECRGAAEGGDGSGAAEGLRPPIRGQAKSCRASLGGQPRAAVPT